MMPACLLCGKTACIRGVFQPDEPEMYGLRKGQGIQYWLCEPCLKRVESNPATAERCEDAIKNRLHMLRWTN